MKSSVSVRILFYCIGVLPVVLAIPLTLLSNSRLSSPSNETLITTTTTSNAQSNDLPPEPYHYAIPHTSLTLIFTSYGHSIDRDDLVTLFERAYHDASLEIVSEGARAYIGSGHHVYANSIVDVMFDLEAQNMHMCWLFFRETVYGMRQVVAHYGGVELEFQVDHDTWGLIATGAFRGT